MEPREHVLLGRVVAGDHSPDHRMRPAFDESKHPRLRYAPLIRVAVPGRP